MPLWLMLDTRPLARRRIDPLVHVERYFRSLAQEVDALKGRVRDLIEDSHWLTDGEWKETVLRQVLRRQLPSSIEVGRGFVVSSAAATHQLDVLLYDSAKPTLFRDGDLVFVTPDAVIGVIEVKSTATTNIVTEAARKLASDMRLIRLHPNHRAFAALFAFNDNNADPVAYLDALASAAETWNDRIDFLSAGPDRFIKYWHNDPEQEQRFARRWHSYELRGLAPGYFVHNVIDAVSPDSVFSNTDVWFPEHGKEPYRTDSRKAKWANK